MYEIGDDWDTMAVGDDEDVIDALLGDDGDEYLVGLPRRGIRRRRRAARRARRGGYGNAAARALLAKEVAQSTLVRKEPPTQARHFPLGFDSGVDIAAAALANINQQPQLVFRPERIVVAGAIAPSFLLTDLRVGKNSQFVSAGAVPAETFSNLSQGVALKMDTAQVSQLIVMSVQNISASPARFIASLLGTALQS